MWLSTNAQPLTTVTVRDDRFPQCNVLAVHVRSFDVYAIKVVLVISVPLHYLALHRVVDNSFNLPSYRWTEYFCHKRSHLSFKF
jgi:hypothetical protein